MEIGVTGKAEFACWNRAALQKRAFVSGCPYLCFTFLLTDMAVALVIAGLRVWVSKLLCISVMLIFVQGLPGSIFQWSNGTQVLEMQYESGPGSGWVLILAVILLLLFPYLQNRSVVSDTVESKCSRI